MNFAGIFVVILNLASAQWSPEQSRLLAEKLSPKSCDEIVKIKTNAYASDFSVLKNSKAYKKASEADKKAYHNEWKAIIEQYEAECRAAIGSGITGRDFCGSMKDKNPEANSSGQPC